MKEEIISQIVQILSRNVEDTSAITPDASLLDDLALDSLQVCEILALAEETFGVDIPHTSIFLVDTIEEVGELIFSLKVQVA